MRAHAHTVFFFLSWRSWGVCNHQAVDWVKQEAPIDVEAREEVVGEQGASMDSVSPYRLLISGQNFSGINALLVF